MRRCYNCYGQTLGYVDGDTIYDASNNVVGFYNDNTIYNRWGYPLGYYDNYRFYDINGGYAGYLYGNSVYNASNYYVGYTDTTSDWLLALALLFLLL